MVAMYWIIVAATYTGMFLLLAAAGIVACGDPRKPGLVNSMSWVLQVWFPSRFRWLVQRLGLECVVNGCWSAFSMCCLRKNYLVMVMYLVLVLGGFGVVLALAYPRVPNRFMAEFPHKLLGLGIMGGCLYTFWMAAFTDPGIVTQENLPQHLNFAFDGLLYKPQVCPTCHLLRPPRSKHCRVLDKCVSKGDHYCIWLVNHVSERNYRWFISFLAVHTAMLLYGAIAVGCIFADEIVEKKLFEQRFRHSTTGKVIPATSFIVFQYLLHRNTELMAVMMLTTVMGVVMIFFTGYHIYLAASNMTTNETMKYSDAREYYVRDHERWEGHCGGIAAVREQILHLLSDSSVPRSKKVDKIVKDAVARTHGIPASKAAEEALRQITLAREGDVGEKTEKEPKEELEALLQLPWFMADPGPEPQPPSNIWSRGWRENLREVFYPPSTRSVEERSKYRMEKPGDYTGAESLEFLREEQLETLHKALVNGAVVPKDLHDAVLKRTSKKSVKG